MLLVGNHKSFGRCCARWNCSAGVCVLAATSRPDLLDAALLRPGRLDRLIYCGFPNTRERGQILHALARRLRLDAAVDLDAVGVQCEGYSGADLSALLSEAQLAAVHERLDLADQHAATHQVCPQHPMSCFENLQASICVVYMTQISMLSMMHVCT